VVTELLSKDYIHRALEVSLGRSHRSRLPPDPAPSALTIRV
jgi:hypothetical protein